MLGRISMRYAVLNGAYTRTGIGGIKVSTWNDGQKEDLLHCYESTAAELVNLKNSIINRQIEEIRDICPYCGIGGHGQFDHYMPKAKFPEFSVHSYNLVPCCDKCNGLKGEAWLQTNGARTFINFYIDSLPAAPMLDVQVQWVVKNGKRVPKVSFHLARPTGFRTESFALIESHFRKLNLLDRYKNQAHTEFLALRDAALGRKAKTVETLRKFLENYLEQRAKTLGPLNWRIALYSKLMEHRPFLQDCL
ncbi:hypothetical protein GCM10027081_07680 [Cupriavidus yeoncheonensis]